MSIYDYAKNVLGYGTPVAIAGGAQVGANVLNEMNTINQLSKVHNLSPKNPISQSLINKNLTGSWVPNKTFEKLGLGPGSTKGWLTSRISPSHFGPVETALNVGKHIGSLGGTITTGLPFAYASGASALQDYLEKQGLTGKGGIADISGLWGAEAAGADVEYDIDDIYNASSRNQLMNRRNQLMNRRKQQMQQTIRQAEAAEAAKQKAAADAAAAAAAKYTAPRHHQDVSRNRGDYTAPTFRSEKKEGIDTKGSGMHGGKHYADGGLINFYRYGGFI